MAGGCGAGSFLDVADILKTVDPGAQWLNDSYSFLYTPDVFHKIDAEGLHPNALAAISELYLEHIMSLKTQLVFNIFQNN